MRCIFRLAKCDRSIAYFLAIIKEMTIEICFLSFGVSYNSVAKKWRVSAIFGRFIEWNPEKLSIFKECNVLNG